MLPDIENDGLVLDFEEEEVQPSKTFKLHTDKNRCYGTTDEVDALIQAIFLMLSIERYDYIIYSWNVGFESKDLIGMPLPYVISEVKRRIPDCLLQDDRILEVDSFEFDTTQKKKLHVKYVAHTIYGEMDLETEVDY